MAEEDDFVRITLRLPAALHAKLTEATERKRSMNAEIIARLEASFEEGAGRPTAEWIAKIATMAVDRALELLNDESTDPPKPRYPRMPMPEDLPPRDEAKADHDQARSQQPAGRYASKKNT